MKKLLLLCIAAAAVAMSCSTEPDAGAPLEGEGVPVTYYLTTDVDVTIDRKPLRDADEGLYFVMVYQHGKNVDYYTMYAVAHLESISEVPLTLYTNNKYDIMVWYMGSHPDYIREFFAGMDPSTAHSYRPVKIDTEYDYEPSVTYGEVWDVMLGSANLYYDDQISEYHSDEAPADRVNFYGYIEAFQPTTAQSAIEVPMQRLNYGFEIKLDNFTQGNIEMSVERSINYDIKYFKKYIFGFTSSGVSGGEYTTGELIHNMPFNKDYNFRHPVSPITFNTTFDMFFDEYFGHNVKGVIDWEYKEGYTKRLTFEFTPSRNEVTTVTVNLPDLDEEEDGDGNEIPGIVVDINSDPLPRGRDLQVNFE